MTGPFNIKVGATETVRTSVNAVRTDLSNLGDLNDVTVSAPEDGDVLQFQALSNTWVAGPLPVDEDIDGGTF